MKTQSKTKTIVVGGVLGLSLLGNALLGGMTFYNYKYQQELITTIEEVNLENQEIQHKLVELTEQHDAVQEELLTTKQHNESLTRERDSLRRESEHLERINVSRSLNSRASMIRHYTTSTNITEPSGVTAEQLNSALVETGLANLGQAYLNAEQNYGVNALVLASIHVHESGWGNSSLARNNNNLGGIKNGRGGWSSFSSKADCIDYSAQLLGEDYLTPEGRYYNGTTLTGVNVRYCETKDWASKVVNTANTLLERMAE